MINNYSAKTGSPVTDLETPALLINADLLDANIEKMATFAKSKDINLRPHFKTHKCPTLSHKQIVKGAIGITCAKVSEAEIAVNSGIKEVLIANQLVTTEKIEKLVSLNRHSKVLVAVDSIKNAQDISKAAAKRGLAITVIIERDVGLKRCGTRSLDESLKLAQAIEKLPNLQMAGLMGYEGHTVFLTPVDNKKDQCRRAMETLLETKEVLSKNGFTVDIVSAGGTGTHEITSEYNGITELQVGSYATMDWKYKETGIDFALALSVLGTVISTPEKNLAIIDVGLKAITAEFGLPVLKTPTGASLVSLSEEHGTLQLNSDASKLSVGDKLELYPTHGCTTINLYDTFYVIRNNCLETTWPIVARGAVR